MHLVKTYVQTDIFDPTNPTQVIREVPAYAPNSMTSIYFNPTAPGATLNGSGLGFWDTLPSWGQIALVALGSATVGYFGMKKFGDSHIKPALKKVGLGRPARRRRR